MRWRCCQTSANQSLVGQVLCPLCCAKSAPLVQCGGTLGFEVRSAGEASFLVEVVRNGGMEGCERLKTSHMPEPEHRPLSSSEWQVRILRPIIWLAAVLRTRVRSELLQSGALRAKLFGDENLCAAMFAHCILKGLQRSLLVAGCLTSAPIGQNQGVRQRASNGRRTHEACAQDRFRR